MEMYIYVIVAVIITVALTSIGFLVAQAKKQGQPIPWGKIRPIVTEAFDEVQKLIVANKLGYQEVEDFVVSFVLNKVDTVDLLGNAEKNIISEGLVRSIVAPGLRELHTKLSKPAEAPKAPEQK